MAGDTPESEKPSIRRRLTTSIKRVMSLASDKKPKSKTSKEASPKPTPGPSTAPDTAAAAGPSIATPEAVTSGKPTAKPAAKPAAKKPETGPPPTLSAAERAQALFKKHGLDIKSSEWPVKSVPQGERVYKEIRMRVHRTCHKCDASYGPDKMCRSCGHKRCKKCPRQPTKKSKDKGKEKVTAKGTATTPGYKKRKGDVTYGITIPNRRGGPDLVYKKVRQRVHRKCHRCETDFAGEKVCGNCKHNRCKKCPREPSKSNKPPGYYDKYDPDDSEPEAPVVPRRTYKRPRLRVRWVCSKCNTTFIEKTKICEGCGCNRDDVGIRHPEKKPKKTFQPTDEELERLNERLKRTALGGTSSSAK